MINGLIDGSTLFEVASLLGEPNLENTYPLAWQCSIDVTSTLINGHHLGLLGTPGFERTPGPSGLLLREVGGFVPRLRLAEQARAGIRANVVEWGKSADGRAKLEEAMLAVQPRAEAVPLHPAANFERWLRHIVEAYWVQQNRYLGGVFEPWHVEPIAAVLGVSTKEVEKIRMLGLDEKVLARYAREFPTDNQSFRELVTCYTIANFIRGRYHDEACRQRGWQYAPHPLRVPALDGSDRVGAYTYAASNTADYFSKIILAAAFTESSVDGRIVYWAKCVSDARKAVIAGELDLYERDRPETSLETAVRGAKRLGMKTHPARIDSVIDASIAVGVTTVTSFTLLDWEGLVAGLLSYGVSQQINLGEWVAGRWFERTKRLKDLANSEPGRLQRT